MSELWIRSQDKRRLINAKTLSAITDLFKREEECEYGIIVNSREIIGLYETEERCIEILDEIQRLMMPKNPLTSELSDVLYEMPEK